MNPHILADTRRHLAEWEDQFKPENEMPPAECMICSMEDSSDSSRVFVDELWAAEVAPGYEVPGWFFLRARRHAEKLTGLNDKEVVTLGRHAHDLVSAVEEVTGAPAVYLLSFGENYTHFHALIAARGEEIAAVHRGGALLQHQSGSRDPVAARALVPGVRAAYDRIVADRDHSTEPQPRPVS